MAEKREKKKNTSLERFGLFVESSLERSYTRRQSAPVLTGRPAVGKWYRLPIEKGITADGSPYHIYLRKGKSTGDLCVFLSGGGIAWDEHSAESPSDMGKMAAQEPRYYWSNLRPITEPMNIQFGIMDVRNRHNPFADWNFLVIPYATADMHIGQNDFVYRTADSTEKVLHFHGYRNFRAGLDEGVARLPKPKRLLLAGDSAGAFAVPALADEILRDYYPDCRQITLLSDSALLMFKRWRRTLRDVWGAEERLWRPSRSSNLTVDWYRDLHEKRGDSLRYLYAGSTRDYLLSAYYNDMANGEPATNPEVQEKYFRQCRRMVRQLREIEPSFQFYIYNYRNMFTHGGTVHTAVRRPEFYHRHPGGGSMAEWLYDAVSGRAYSEGLELLAKREKGERR